MDLATDLDFQVLENKFVVLVMEERRENRVLGLGW